MTKPRIVRVAHARIGGEWRSDALVTLAPSLSFAEGDEAPLPTLPVTLLPPLNDAHVHLGLASPRASNVGRVLDLGWDPDAVPAVIAWHQRAHPLLDVLFAGAYLTAPGGYPTDREWAPSGAAVEVASAPDAAAAVAAQAAAGAALVKVAMNAEAGPVLDGATLAAIVGAARVANLAVAAHVQGQGQLERALNAGVRVIAHTPWEPLTDAVVVEAARKTVWISTLGMHVREGEHARFALALDNLRRFVAEGGLVVYGTDLGNGSSELSLDDTEVSALRAAGVGDAQLLDALLAEPLAPLLSWPRAAAAVLPPHVMSDTDAIGALGEAIHTLDPATAA